MLCSTVVSTVRHAARHAANGRDHRSTNSYHLRMNMTPTIALIHGWGTGPEIWNPVRDQCASISLSTVIHELPGYGSRSHEDSNLNIQQLADDAAERLPGNAIWVGWSLGAMVALAAAIKENTSIAGVMGLCATAKFVTNSEKADALVELRKAVETDAAKATSRFQRSMPSSANRRSITKQLRNVSAGIISKETLLSGLDVLSRADLTEEVNKISVPVRLISGTEDPIIDASAAIELNRLIPGSQYTALPCGHVPFLECPQLFSEQLFEFAQTFTDSPTNPGSV